MASSRINVGDFDTRVEFQSAESTQGTQGERLIHYSTFLRPMAKVERDVDESVIDSNLESRHNLRVTTYKCASLSTRCRVIVNDAPYEIRSIDMLDRISPFCEIQIHAIDG